ncbi:MAG: c-type cytochrome [Thiobacillus sp.]|nr:c-type cytochrome [Thiobacillus sp.]
MNKLLALMVLALVALPAQASPELANKSKCMTCHQVDKKVLGPSFKEIAAKYKGDKTAEAMLTDSITKGVKGKWGKIPMPAQKVSAADAAALAKWILSL